MLGRSRFDRRRFHAPAVTVAIVSPGEFPTWVAIDVEDLDGLPVGVIVEDLDAGDFGDPIQVDIEDL